MQHQEVVDLLASDDDDDNQSSFSRRSRRRTSSSDLLASSPENSPPRARLRRDDATLNDARSTNDGRSRAAAARDRAGRQAVISLMDSPEVQPIAQNSDSNDRSDERRAISNRRRNNRPGSRQRVNEWACDRCTLLNSHHLSRCSVCETPRNNADTDDVIFERTTSNNSNANHPTSRYFGGGAFLGSVIGAADGYASGTGVARGAVRGAVSGAVGGVLMGEVLRSAPPPPRSTNYQNAAAAAAGRSYRHSNSAQFAASSDGWGRRSNDPVPQYFNSYHNGTYIRNNPTLLDQFLPSMQHQRQYQHQQVNIDAMSYEQILERFGDGNENRNLAASPRVISSLPCATVTDPHDLPENKRQCVICMEEYERGDERTTLPCCHCFHRGCVNRWLGSAGTCPVCKTDVG